MTPPVTITVHVHDDHLLVHWQGRTGQGSCRFDHVPGSVPEWLGSAEDLFEGASRRDEGQILDALMAHDVTADRQLGLWHDGEGVELL